MVEWYKKSVDEVLHSLKSSLQGLSSHDVVERQEKYGKNVLPKEKALSWPVIIFHQIHNPLIYLLFVAAGISGALRSWNDAVVILIVIVVNSIIGASQEWSAEQSSLSLQELLVIKARVKRDGRVEEVAAEELVPGDIVTIEAGMKVPADMRLVEVFNLGVDQSFLTGESHAAYKKSAALEKECRLTEQTNMLFAGSTVIGGLAMGVVVATGLESHVGKIAAAVSGSHRADTPLMIKLSLFAQQVSIVSFVACLIVLLAGLFWSASPSELFAMSIALLVSAIPEGLPIAVTVALSIGSRRMANRKVVVRRLAAVEALGACSCIATDKTGTLTVNKQTVVKIVLPSGKQYDVSGQGYNNEGELLCDGQRCASIPGDVSDLALAGFLCNQSYLAHEEGRWRYSGDDVDLAFNALGQKLKIDTSEAVNCATIQFQFPFDSTKRCAATVYGGNGVTITALKGAAEEILARCSFMHVNGEKKNIQEEAMNRSAEELAVQGFRVLAVARAELSNNLSIQEWQDIDQLSYELLGFVGLTDPVRPQVPSAIKRCQSAGIRVIMVTGDHPQTALSVARQAGIAQEDKEVITGSELERQDMMDPEKIVSLLGNKTLFARVTPAQKVSIVEACKRKGYFVAVTGDGANDAPALKIAHLGIAMGSGTDNAKQAALAVITDDNFASIVAGVEQGKIAYSNIRKVLFLLISTAVAQIVCIVCTLVAGLPMPLLPMQLLWLNLVTNGFQDIALACEPGEPNILHQQVGESSTQLFDWRMVTGILFSGCFMAVIGIVVWVFLTYSSYEISYARNLFCLLFVLMLNMHILNARSEQRSLFSLPFFSNYLVLIGMLIAQGFHIISMYIPVMQRLLFIQPINFGEWAVLLALALSVIPAVELMKLIFRLREKSHS